MGLLLHTTYPLIRCRISLFCFAFLSWSLYRPSCPTLAEQLSRSRAFSAGT